MGARVQGVRVVDPEKNLLRITFFVIGFVMGVLAPYIIGRVTPAISAQTMNYNACPRDADGVAQCKGVFPKDEP